MHRVAVAGGCQRGRPVEWGRSPEGGCGSLVAGAAGRCGRVVRGRVVRGRSLGRGCLPFGGWWIGVCGFASAGFVGCGSLVAGAAVAVWSCGAWSCGAWPVIGEGLLAVRRMVDRGVRVRECGFRWVVRWWLARWRCGRVVRGRVVRGRSLGRGCLPFGGWWIGVCGFASAGFVGCGSLVAGAAVAVWSCGASSAAGGAARRSAHRPSGGGVGPVLGVIATRRSAWWCSTVVPVNPERRGSVPAVPGCGGTDRRSTRRACGAATSGRSLAVLRPVVVRVPTRRTRSRSRSAAARGRRVCPTDDAPARQGWRATTWSSSRPWTWDPVVTSTKPRRRQCSANDSACSVVQP